VRVPHVPVEKVARGPHVGGEACGRSGGWEANGWVRARWRWMDDSRSGFQLSKNKETSKDKNKKRKEMKGDSQWQRRKGGEGEKNEIGHCQWG
jgi:hypothetical protein